MSRRIAFIAMIFLLSLSFAAQAQSSQFKKWINKFSVDHYQQDEPLKVDPKGDAILIRKLDQVPGKLAKALFKKSYPQAHAQEAKELQAIEEKKSFKIGKTIPIDINRFLVACRLIMQKYHPHITPKVGKEHKWSKEAKKHLYFGFWKRLSRRLRKKQKEVPCPLFFSSKLFVMLSCGWTSRYAITGKEAALKERIMLYPDRLMYPHHMFMESYVLNRGDLYSTLLTCENVLAGDPYRENRDDDPVQKKLVYIRHDSEEYGDNYGAWYHFFGIALYGLVRPGIVSRAVAEIESFGSLFLEGKDRQENFINRHGAIFGKKLRKLIKRGTWKNPMVKGESTVYMRPNPLRKKQD